MVPCDSFDTEYIEDQHEHMDNEEVWFSCLAAIHRRGNKLALRKMRDILLDVDLRPKNINIEYEDKTALHLAVCSASSPEFLLRPFPPLLSVPSDPRGMLAV